MNSIGKHLAADLNTFLQTRVASINPTVGGHEVFDDKGERYGTFDAVIISAPAEHTCDLLANYQELIHRIERIEMLPCWATMVSLHKSVTEDWVGAFVHDSFLSWIARNSTKPNREGDYENIVIHAKPQWSTEHWEDDPESVAELTLDELWRVTKLPPQSPAYKKSHRWKFALAKEPDNQECFFDPDSNIGACGDWANGSRVEGAFLSGMAVVGCLLRRLSKNLEPNPHAEHSE